MTALGIALTVTTAIFLMALLAGLHRAFVNSGNPLNVLVLRKGSEAELSGGFDASLYPTLKTLPGIAKDSHGEPMTSGEWVVVIILPRKDGTGEVNVTVRGMMPDGLEMRQLPGPENHPGVKLVAGEWFHTGQREVVVSKSIRDRFTHANIGDTMEFGKGSWKVVGVFDAGGSAYESEVWGDVNQMASDFDRQGGYSSAYLHATDPIAADALKNRVSDDQRLKLEGVLETDYYAKQTSSGAPIKVIGIVVAFIMAIGSIFAAMNTMYAAVAYRGREIATLRVIGFSRPCDPDFVCAGVVAAGAFGCARWNFAHAAVQRNADWNVQRSDIQRSRVCVADHAAGGHVCDCLRTDHGIRRRTCSGVACGAAEYSECAAQLESAGILPASGAENGIMKLTESSIRKYSYGD